MLDIRKFTRLMVCVIVTFTTIAMASDKYVLPQGAGKKDGSSFADALAAEGGGLQKAWDQLAAGETCHVGSGNYKEVRLNISGGGEAGKAKTLAGVDTGAGLPVFEGNWKKDQPAEGMDFIKVKKGASHWALQNLRVQRYRLGVVCEGRNVAVRITNCNIKEGREGIIFEGGVDLERPEVASNDIVVTDCTFSNYTKRGVRIRGGVYNAQFIRCTADGGGPDYGVEKFPVGFAVAEKVTGAKTNTADKQPAAKADDAESETPKPAAVREMKQVNGVTVPADRERPYDHDITFTDCVAKNHYFDAGKDGYWQGDGFGGESNSYNIRYVRCKAFDNTDGGWDTKSLNVRLEDCIALRNKRNYRFWAELAEGTTMLRCLAAFAKYPGGSGGSVGLWTKGKLRAEDSTFHNNGVQVALDSSHAKVELVRCIISADQPKQKLIEAVEGAQLVKTECAEWSKDGAGEDPKLTAPRPDWDGEGENFDSQLYGKTKGFRRTTEAAAK